MNQRIQKNWKLTLSDGHAESLEQEGSTGVHQYVRRYWHALVVYSTLCVLCWASLPVWRFPLYVPARFQMLACSFQYAKLSAIVSTSFRVSKLALQAVWTSRVIENHLVTCLYG